MMFVSVAKKMAVASLVGPSQAALDAVTRHYGYVYEQAQRNYQRGHRHLLQVDSQHVGNAEGHAERNRNGQGHDERQAPFPKSNQRNNDDKDDRFVQGTQE